MNAKRTVRKAKPVSRKRASRKSTPLEVSPRAGSPRRAVTATQCPFGRQCDLLQPPVVAEGVKAYRCHAPAKCYWMFSHPASPKAFPSARRASAWARAHDGTSRASPESPVVAQKPPRKRKVKRALALPEEIDVVSQPVRRGKVARVRWWDALATSRVVRPLKRKRVRQLPATVQEEAAETVLSLQHESVSVVMESGSPTITNEAEINPGGSAQPAMVTVEDDTWYCMGCSRWTSGEFCSLLVQKKICGTVRVDRVGAKRKRESTSKYVAALTGRKYATLSRT